MSPTNKKINKQETRINWVLAVAAIVSALAALISAVYAGNANRKADAANIIAADANRIALESNNINSFSVSPNITFNPKNAIFNPWLRGCKDGNQYNLWVIAPFSYTFSNSGGASTQIIDFYVSSSDKVHYWLSSHQFWESQPTFSNTPINLPVNIPAESSVVLGFKAIKPLVGSDSLDEINSMTSKAANLIEDKLTWTFVFGNNQYITIDAGVGNDLNLDVDFDSPFCYTY